MPISLGAKVTFPKLLMQIPHLHINSEVESQYEITEGYNVLSTR